MKKFDEPNKDLWDNRLIDIPTAKRDIELLSDRVRRDRLQAIILTVSSIIVFMLGVSAVIYILLKEPGVDGIITIISCSIVLSLFFAFLAKAVYQNYRENLGRLNRMKALIESEEFRVDSYSKDRKLRVCRCCGATLTLEDYTKKICPNCGNNMFD